MHNFRKNALTGFCRRVAPIAPLATSCFVVDWWYQGPCLCETSPQSSSISAGTDDVPVLPAARRCWPKIAPQAAGVLWKFYGRCTHGLTHGQEVPIASDSADGAQHGVINVENEKTQGLRWEWWDKSWNDGLRTDNWRSLQSAAHQGQLSSWASSEDPMERIALIILLDQVSRTLYGGTARAYASDRMARTVAMQALDDGMDLKVPIAVRVFFYFPLLHSENIHDQRRSVALFRQLAAAEPALKPLEETAAKHCEAVEFFGRIPERNKPLCRRTTEQEAIYMKFNPTC